MAQRSIRIQLDVLDLSSKRLSSIDAKVLAGQVNVAADADGPTRSMTVSLYDPDHRLRLDSDAPGDGALYADRMLRAFYGVLVPEVGWVDVPVFTGPIVKMDRDDAIVNVECQGKEFFALKPAWRTFTVGKGVKKVDAIRRIMREQSGESRFDLPNLNVRLPKPVTVAREKGVPWAAAKSIARGMDRQLFYDGWGRLRLRAMPDQPLFAFTNDHVKSVPQVSFDSSEARNAVRVTGKTLHEGKEKKKQIPTKVTGGEAVADRSHPLSPWRLGRGGQPMFWPEFVTNDSVRSDKEARALARRILNNRLRQAVDVSFDSLVVPHLEEMDLVRTSYDDLAMVTRLRRFTIPLTHDGDMAVGYVRQVSRPTRRKVNRK